MVWGESDDEKFGPDGRYGRWLHEDHATGRDAEVRRAARVLQVVNPEMSLQEAERLARERLNDR